MENTQKNIKKHRAYLLALAAAILAASAWTLIRFFDQPPTFDLVGQQVLASQWIHGVHSGVFIGPTNYILKILFIYIPFSFVHLSALTNLIIMTLLVYAATFVLIALALNSLWHELYPSTKPKLAVPLLYLGLISGSVFWIQFSNSRNLEIAGGLFLIYLCLRVAREPSWKRYVGLALFSGLLFFADPLQIYMSFLPALAFVLIRSILDDLSKAKVYVVAAIVASGGIGFLLSKAILKILNRWLNVAIDSHPPTTSPLSIHQWTTGIKSTVGQVARLYAGGFEGGRLREALNLATLLVVILIGLYYLWKKPKTRPILSIAAVVWAVNLFVYIASNQANQGGTSRYLIMTVPFFILVAGVVLQNIPKTRGVVLIVTGVLAFNFVTLGSVFMRKWDPGFKEFSHAQQVADHIENSDYKYGYGSMDTAIIADYLSKNTKVLPLGCQPDATLKPASLFFDKGGFNINKLHVVSVPLALDGSSIQNKPSVCDIPHISSQFGTPLQNYHLSDGSTVLLYNSSQINR